MKKLSHYELHENPFSLIEKKWAMITTRSENQINTMTASWGGLGVLWNMPVAYLFVRPQRYSRELLDQSERFSLCFLPEKYRGQLAWCGTHSGREVDKFEHCGFTCCELDDAPAIAQSDLIITCHKLYRQPMKPDCFAEQDLLESNYPNEDYHVMYMAEILGVYEK